MGKLPRDRVTATSRKRILQWLDSPEIDAAFLGDDLKFSVLLLDQYEAGVERILAERSELGELSWLGGPALGPMEQWPRNTDGEPLAHIATIQLGEAQALIESPDFTEPDWPEATVRLPESGYLEVFHHLGTYGNPEDEGTGGWLVRHLPLTGEYFPPLVDGPEDLEVPHPVCQPVLLGTGFSLPRAVEFIDDAAATFEAAERVEEEANATWMAWRQGADSVTGPVIPTSHLYGHSNSGDTYAHEILTAVRPLEPGDTYVLILSVESWTHFEGWFADVGNFEVWMRASDLKAQRFDQAWCMIRTDH